MFDIVGQRVVEYGILNEFAERVQKSILDNELANIIKHECCFCFITLLSYFPAVFDEIRGVKYCVLYSPVGRYGVKIENYGKYYNFKTVIT